MLSRALALATVMLLIGGFAAEQARAQNLEAGKSPSQIFSGTCTACHKGARGLLRTVAPASLPGFLRQHYTTSGDMASVLAAYLISNGATDTRYLGGQPKQGREAKQEPSGQPTQLDRSGRPIRRAPAQEAARPDADGRVPQTDPEGRGRRPADGQTPAASTDERGPDGRKLSTRQRLSKRGKPEEPPKSDAAKPAAPMGEAAKDEAAKDENANNTKEESGKAEAKPDEPKSDSAKLDAPKGEAPKSDVPVRADPVPAVTPAEKPSDVQAKPTETPATGAPSGSSSSAASATSEPQGAPAPAAPPAMAMSPPPPPVAPAGPPVPPISQ